MIINIDKLNIELTPNNLEQHDIKFINKYQPYKRGSVYVIPNTPTALEYIKENFEVENIDNKILELSTLHALNIWNQEYTTQSYLRNYQEQGINWALSTLKRTQGAGLFWEPRTGKTITSCKIIEHYKRVVVLSLSGQEQNWVDTLNQINYQGTIINLYKQTPQKRKLSIEKFNSLNSVVLIGSIETITKLAKDNQDVLRDIDLLVIDEAHKLKNKTQARTGGLNLRKNSKYCLALTGTPTSKRTSEMVLMFSLIWPQHYSKTYLSNYFFTMEYNEYSQWGTPDEVKEDKFNEWLEFLALHFSQVKKEQALYWNKPPNIQNIYLELPPDQEKVYKNCLFYQEIEQDNKEVLQINEAISLLMRLRQVATCPNTINVSCSNVKVNWLLEFIRLNPNQPLIIFTTFTSLIEPLYYFLWNNITKKINYITGETKNKTKIANDFQNGEYDILLCNIQAGSKGITLDRSNILIFLDEDWRPDENKQAIERITSTTPDRVANKYVYRLMINNSYMIDNEETLSIDKYIRLVNENKIEKTKVENHFKEILQNKF